MRAAIGAQDLVHGDGSIPRVSDGLLTAVAFAASTVYKFQLPSGGASALDCTLKLASHTGTVPTAKLYATYADGVTQKGAAVNFGALADATAVLASITTLRGERYVVLEITVPAASTAVFGQAEYSAL